MTQGLDWNTVAKGAVWDHLDREWGKKTTTLECLSRSLENYSRRPHK